MQFEIDNSDLITDDYDYTDDNIVEEEPQEEYKQAPKGPFLLDIFRPRVLGNLLLSLCHPQSPQESQKKFNYFIYLLLIVTII